MTGRSALIVLAATAVAAALLAELPSASAAPTTQPAPKVDGMSLDDPSPRPRPKPEPTTEPATQSATQPSTQPSTQPVFEEGELPPEDFWVRQAWHLGKTADYFRLYGIASLLLWLFVAAIAVAFAFEMRRLTVYCAAGAGVIVCLAAGCAVAGLLVLAAWAAILVGVLAARRRWAGTRLYLSAFVAALLAYGLADLNSGDISLFRIKTTQIEKMAADRQQKMRKKRDVRQEIYLGVEESKRDREDFAGKKDRLQLLREKAKKAKKAPPKSKYEKIVEDAERAEGKEPAPRQPDQPEKAEAPAAPKEAEADRPGGEKPGESTPAEEGEGEEADKDPEEVPTWAKQKKQRVVAEKKDKSSEWDVAPDKEGRKAIKFTDLGRKVQESVRQEIGLRGRELPMNDVNRAQKFDRGNLFAVGVTLWIAVLMVLLDYLNRFNRTFDSVLPLPIAGEIVDKFFDKAHTVYLRADEARPVRNYLEWAVRKRETFLLLAQRDPWKIDRLSRLPIEKITIPEKVAEKIGVTELKWELEKLVFEGQDVAGKVEFIFESAWFDRYCLVVCGEDAAKVMLDAVVKYLKLRQETQAKARRTVNIVWNVDTPLSAETLEELVPLLPKSNFKLIYVSPAPPSPDVAGRFDELYTWDEARQVPAPLPPAGRQDRLQPGAS